jgi:ankyrin repeat protein
LATVARAFPIQLSIKDLQQGKYTFDLERAGAVKPLSLGGLLAVTPLHIAARKRDSAIVQALLAAGVHPDQKSLDGTTALHVLFAGRGHGTCNDAACAAVGAMLLRARADPDAINGRGETPLYLASSQGLVEATKLLLSSTSSDADGGGGANPNTRVRCGGVNRSSSPLHIAAAKGFAEVVALLLQAGANPDLEVTSVATQRHGMTPLHYAADTGHVAAARALLCGGARADKRDSNGVSPIVVACSRGHTEIVRTMLQLGQQVDPNHICTVAESNATASAVQIAAIRGRSEVVKLLSVHGAVWEANVATGVLRTEQPVTSLMRTKGFTELACWLEGVATARYAPFEIAISLQMPTDATVALRLGHIDPDDCYDGHLQPTASAPKAFQLGMGASATQAAPSGRLHAVVRQATSTAARLRAKAHACHSTRALATAALTGWSPRVHWLHHAGVRAAIKTCLLVAERLRWHRTVPAAPPQTEKVALPLKRSRCSRSSRILRSHCTPKQTERRVLMAVCHPRAVVLPPEIWLLLLSFVRRGDFAVGATACQ